MSSSPQAGSTITIKYMHNKLYAKHQNFSQVQIKSISSRQNMTWKNEIYLGKNRKYEKKNAGH